MLALSRVGSSLAKHFGDDGELKVSTNWCTKNRRNQRISANCQGKLSKCQTASYFEQCHRRRRERKRGREDSDTGNIEAGNYLPEDEVPLAKWKGRWWGGDRGAGGTPRLSHAVVDGRGGHKKSTIEVLKTGSAGYVG